jgi:U3 small nucleolar RNA-associated protein 12
VSESGIIKLQGHKDAITGLMLLEDVLISSANDSFLKIWDLKTFACIENVSTSRGAIGAIQVINGKYLVLGLEDSSLKVYNIDSRILNLKKSHTSGTVPGELLDSDGNLIKCLVEIGNLERASKEKVLNIKLLDNFLGVQSADSVVEFYKIRSDQELEKKLARRRKRNKDSEQEVTLSITDYIPKIAQLKVSAKTKSFDFELKEKQSDHFRVLVQLTNNTLEWHEMIIGKKEAETRLLSEISWQGHRSDVRALALSSDDQMYASGSSGKVFELNIRFGKDMEYRVTRVYSYL